MKHKGWKIPPSKRVSFRLQADGSGPGMCDLLHCGTSFCPAGEPLCRIESKSRLPDKALYLK